MRTAFIKTLTALAEADKNVWLVTGDLGFSVFEDFITRFPDQYLNVGVAEQNLIGVSAGLALAGKRPFAYSISTFATMRPLEQIRNDICYQNLPVVIVGGGSTFSYSTFGCTHFPLEDLALMRALPNMSVCCPGDPREVAALLQAASKHKGPLYLRLAKKGEPVVHADDTAIELGKMVEVRAGNDAAIVVAGRQLPNAVAAAELLRKVGIATRVLSCHTLKPFDAPALLKAARETKALVTVEEHSLIGGLASAVAETLSQGNVAVRLRSLGVPDEFPSGVGSQDFFLARYNLTAEGIERAVKEALKT